MAIPKIIVKMLVYLEKTPFVSNKSLIRRNVAHPIKIINPINIKLVATVTKIFSIYFKTYKADFVLPFFFINPALIRTFKSLRTVSSENLDNSFLHSLLLI